MAPGFQPQAAGDLFTALDPACGVFPPFNTQILDGDGLPLAPAADLLYGPGDGPCGALPTARPPFNDDVSASTGRFPACARSPEGSASRSRAGSPTLTPGTNPLLPLGAEPGDLLVAFPASPPLPAVPRRVHRGRGARPRLRRSRLRSARLRRHGRPLAELPRRGYGALLRHPGVALHRRLWLVGCGRHRWRRPALPTLRRDVPAGSGDRARAGDRRRGRPRVVRERVPGRPGRRPRRRWARRLCDNCPGIFNPEPGRRRWRRARRRV